MEYRLYAVRVFVTDWERAIKFYTQTLGIATTFENAEMGWAQLATGDGQLAIERMDPADPEAKGLIGRYVGVSLEVKDIDETYRTLVERGVEFKSPPTKQPSFKKAIIKLGAHIKR